MHRLLFCLVILVLSFSDLVFCKTCYNTNLHNLTELTDLQVTNNISVKMHCVITKDGYHLSLFRITDNSATDVNSRQPLFIQHGLGGNGLEFTLELEGSNMKSLASYLVKAGFDVWVSNSRGTLFSKYHDTLKLRDRKYWNWSFHEMGVYDLPAMLEYAYEQTSKQNKIIFFGHSMGTNIFGAYAATMKEHAQKYLKKAVLVSPVIFMKHTKVSLSRIPHLFEFIFIKLHQIGFPSLFSEKSLEKRIVMDLCVTKNNYNVCGSFLNFMNGKSSRPGKEYSKAMLRIWPDEVSIKTLLHFLQTIKAKGTAPMYNYGPKVNQIVYKSKNPPNYDIEGIQIPIHIFYGGSDALAPQEDAELLFNTLNTKKTIQCVTNYNHVDFVFGRDIETKFLRPLVERLREK